MPHFERAERWGSFLHPMDLKGYTHDSASAPDPGFAKLIDLTWDSDNPAGRHSRLSGGICRRLSEGIGLRRQAPCVCRRRTNRKELRPLQQMAPRL